MSDSSDSKDKSLSRRKWLGMAATASLGTGLLAMTKAVAEPSITDREGQAERSASTKAPERPIRLHHVRHALLADPLGLQVQTWLRPVYRRIPFRFPAAVANQTIAAMVRVLSPMLDRDSRLQSAMQEVVQSISSPLRAEYIDLYESIKRPASTMPHTFVSIVYARALLLLRPSMMDGPAIVADLKNILSEPAASLDKYLEKQRALPSDFVGHLVTLAEVEAQTDPQLGKIMDEAAQWFGAHKPNQSARDPLHEAGSRLEEFGSDHESAWWVLPATLAFAMTVWEQTGFSQP